MTTDERRQGGVAGSADFSGRDGSAGGPRVGTVAVTVDGVTVTVPAGRTVAAALVASGKQSWRETRIGRKPRGVFCGIGACFDCLVTVNGIPDVRACQRTVADGDEIRTHYGATLPDATTADPPPPDWAVAHAPTSAPRSPERADGAPVPQAPVAHVTPSVPSFPAQDTSRPSPSAAEQHGDRVVIVGAGPAGLRAAVSAARAGAPVLVVDAGTAIGGQYHRQPAVDRLHTATGEFADLCDELRDSPLVEVLNETTVWAIEPVDGGHRLHLQTGPADAPGRLMRTVETRALVLATGAYDRVLPFPGWDLPGVYTAGAAQALAKGQGIAVGRRVLLAGTGPFLLPVAHSLLAVGVRPLALLDANRPMAIARGWLTDVAAARRKAGEAGRYAVMLARHRIGIRHGTTVIAAHGTDRVEAVTTARLDAAWNPIAGTEQQLEVDAVCVGFGFTAQLELAVSARCRIAGGPDGGAAVVVDGNQITSTEGVLAAGELTGIGGADLAAAEGAVAGATAAALLGHGTGATDQQRKKVVQGNRFARALANAYPVKPGWQSWLTDDTLVCRCEEVSYQDLRDAFEQRQVRDTRAIKLTSRAGLGLCQGRVCARNTAELTAALDATIEVDPVAGSRRPIAVPVRLRDLANAPQEET